MGAINKSRDRMRANFEEEAGLDRKKKRYCTLLRHAQWDEGRPFVINARDWAGSTAVRYIRRRNVQLDQLRREMEHYRGWVQDVRQRQGLL